MTDPVNTVEAIGHGFMDSFQTPEGIAALSGNIIESIGGGWAGKKAGGAQVNVDFDNPIGNIGGGARVLNDGSIVVTPGIAIPAVGVSIPAVSAAGATVAGRSCEHCSDRFRWFW